MQVDGEKSWQSLAAVLVWGHGTGWPGQRVVDKEFVSGMWQALKALHGAHTDWKYQLPASVSITSF